MGKTAVAAIKTAFDIAKGLKDIDNATSRSAAVIELQEKILSAQRAQATLVERIGALEAEVTRLKEWKASKDAYRLESVGPGALAYVSQPNADRPESPHWLGVKCFDAHQRSVLQFQTRSPDKRNGIYGCHTCNGTISVPWSRNPEQHAKQSTSERERAPGDPCPSCGAYEYRVQRSEAHREMSDMGVRVHYMKCGSCSFEDERIVTP